MSLGNEKVVSPSVRKSSSFASGLFQELSHPVAATKSCKNSYDREHSISEKSVSSFIELADDFKSQKHAIGTVSKTKQTKEFSFFNQPPNPSSLPVNSPMLSAENLEDHSFTTCGQVRPLQHIYGSIAVERQVWVTSKHMAWCLSSQFILELLTRKSRCSQLCASYSSSGTVFTLVGELPVVEQTVDLIRQLVFLGVDSLMAMPDIAVDEK
jgi:hypothetical protein